jgi:hypothetical protein
MLRHQTPPDLPLVHMLLASTLMLHAVVLVLSFGEKGRQEQQQHTKSGATTSHAMEAIVAGVELVGIE